MSNSMRTAVVSRSHLAVSSPVAIGRAVRGEITKVTTLRVWWIGLAVISLLTFYFAYINAALFAELAESEEGGYFTDFDGSRVLIEHAVRETILASPYQSAALIIPILVTFVAGSEFLNHQHVTTRLAVPAASHLLIAKVIASSILCTAVVFFSFVVSLAALVLLLDGSLREQVLSPVAVEVFVALWLYALTLNFVAEALTAAFRKTVPALVFIVGLLVVALSGILSAISSFLGNLIPMIGAKTLLFGYPDSEQAFTSAQGIILLAVWAVCALGLWAFALRESRDL